MTAFYMDAGSHSILRRAGAAALACAAATALTLVMTWPLAAGFGSLGRTAPGDGPYSIWNIAWLAHALTSDPLHLLDANMFHPHPRTLVFSELNLVAGLVAVPGWLLTGNPYVAHNSALVFAFATSALGAWLLVRRLTGSSVIGAVAGILYAFSPYFFAHTPHIQLLMGGGIPLSLLMLYRVLDVPSPARGAALGLTLAIQALACAYYGIFAGLLVGYAAILLGITRRQWRSPGYWRSLAVGAAVSIAIVLPFFVPYVSMQTEGGFRRTIEDSVRYSANLQSYFASAAHAHLWLLDIVRRWPRFIEVLFPGFLTLVFAAGGAVAVLRSPGQQSGRGADDRETLLLFGSFGVLAFWASFGPAAGLYSLFYYTVPVFTFLRAPSRLGLLVVLALIVIAAIGMRRMLARVNPRHRTAIGCALLLAAVLELNRIPFGWERAPVLPAPYKLLAQLPRGPVAEFPFYGGRIAYHLHTQYMLFSTAHWFPLVNGYSDYFPPDFREAATVLDSFPSNDAFNVLRKRRVRYIVIHWDMFGSRRTEIEERLRPYEQNLRPLAEDPNVTLYEVVFYP